MTEANFELVVTTKHTVWLRDVGPWDKHPTITNDAVGVCRRVAVILRGRRLFYFDSRGEATELLLDAAGHFRGFKCGPMVGPIHHAYIAGAQPERNDVRGQ